MSWIWRIRKDAVEVSPWKRRAWVEELTVGKGQGKRTAAPGSGHTRAGEFLGSLEPGARDGRRLARVGESSPASPPRPSPARSHRRPVLLHLARTV